MSTLGVASVATLAITLLVAAASNSCTHDFERFEGQTSASTGDASDDSNNGSIDGSVPPNDASSSDARAGDGSVDGGCRGNQAPVACLSQRETCRNACDATYNTCEDACNNNNCRFRCRSDQTACRNGCNNTCRSCSGPCTQGCD